MDKELPLFREAACVSDRGRPGAPISATPTSWRVLTTFLCLLFVCVAFFVSTQTIVRRETAVGVLSLSLGEIRILPPRSGVLTEIYVAESDEVVDGQRLAYISTAQYFVDGGGVEGQLLEALA